MTAKLKSTFLLEYPEAYDFDEMYDSGSLVRLENHPEVYYWQSKYVLKLGGTKYEMNMIHLAGDCAVPVVRGVVQDGEYLGFVMKKETPLSDAFSGLPVSAKRPIMTMMKSVVEELHSRNIIHRDLKLANMLLCSDGKVRLCDFAGAILVNDSSPPSPINTVSWLSPYRTLHLNDPSTVEDDLFALGVSIWELFTEKRPFEGLKDLAVRHLIRNGGTIDISEIEDEEAHEIVKGLMAFMLVK